MFSVCCPRPSLFLAPAALFCCSLVSRVQKQADEKRSRHGRTASSQTALGATCPGGCRFQCFPFAVPVLLFSWLRLLCSVAPLSPLFKNKRKRSETDKEEEQHPEPLSVRVVPGGGRLQCFPFCCSLPFLFLAPSALFCCPLVSCVQKRAKEKRNRQGRRGTCRWVCRPPPQGKISQSKPPE